ncbi:MAG: 30S ribosomal protein S17 [Candidatus Pacebacteria bacterium]|nr:30S ribosomal protein S17 [Candidatus Paceibacterota bacterium]MCF7857420.1 30S ribosomal protein S17 [Candidatus Paceibacterota bacterium]
MATEKTTTETTLANGRVLRGTVVSTKMQDTVTVAVERYVMHPKYKKFMRKTKKFLVDDKGNTTKVGDKVEIREIRPLSKRKHFELKKG